MVALAEGAGQSWRCVAGPRGIHPLLLPVRDPLPLLHDVYYTMSRQMTPESSTLVNTF